MDRSGEMKRESGVAEERALKKNRKEKTGLFFMP